MRAHLEKHLLKCQKRTRPTLSPITMKGIKKYSGSMFCNCAGYPLQILTLFRMISVISFENSRREFLLTQPIFCNALIYSPKNEPGEGKISVPITCSFSYWKCSKPRRRELDS